MDSWTHLPFRRPVGAAGWRHSDQQPDIQNDELPLSAGVLKIASAGRWRLGEPKCLRGGRGLFVARSS
jgi:hypothetical protein